jgi:hypothetical protein
VPGFGFPGGCRITALGDAAVTVIEGGRSNTVWPVFAGPCIACPVGDEVLFCPDGASVAAVGRAGFRQLCAARGPVALIAADRTFRIVAVATTDGLVRVFDLPTGSEVRGADIGGEARLLAITPKWGCVVAAVADDVVVLSVNGELVTRQRLPWRIAAWWPFASVVDFDHVAFVTEARAVGTFEALHPDRNTLFQEAKGSLAAVLFDAVSGSFVLLSEEGQLLVLPYSRCE